MFFFRIFAPMSSRVIATGLPVFTSHTAKSGILSRLKFFIHFVVKPSFGRA